MQLLASTTLTLAYTPFIDPIDAHRAWYWLIIPLAFGIAVVYKAMRVIDLKQYPKQVLVMTAQVVGAMVLLGIGSFVLIQHIVPRILPPN